MQSLVDSGYTFIEIFVLKAYWIIRIQMNSVIVLMACLIRIPSLSLAALFKEIYFGESASTYEMNQLIMKWRKKYIRIRALVAELNDCFSQPMLFFILICFIASINTIFNAITKILSNRLLFLVDNIVDVVVSVIFFSLLTFVSDQVPRQVSEINIIGDRQIYDFD